MASIMGVPKLLLCPPSFASLTFVVLHGGSLLFWHDLPPLGLFSGHFGEAVPGAPLLHLFHRPGAIVGGILGLEAAQERVFFGKSQDGLYAVEPGGVPPRTPDQVPSQGEAAVGHVQKGALLKVHGECRGEGWEKGDDPSVLPFQGPPNSLRPSTVQPYSFALARAVQQDSCGPF